MNTALLFIDANCGKLALLTLLPILAFLAVGLFYGRAGKKVEILNGFPKVVGKILIVLFVIDIFALMALSAYWAGHDCPGNYYGGRNGPRCYDSNTGEAIYNWRK
jgi:hypothetical protein